MSNIIDFIKRKVLLPKLIYGGRRASTISGESPLGAVLRLVKKKLRQHANGIDLEKDEARPEII